MDNNKQEMYIPAEHTVGKNLAIASIRQHLMEQWKNTDSEIKEKTKEIIYNISCKKYIDAFLRAAQLGDHKLLSMMLKYNLCDVNGIISDGGNPALCVAAMHGHLECVRFLLNNGANVNAVSNSPPPIYTACSYPILILSESSIPPHVTHNLGTYIDIIKILVTNGAVVDCGYQQNETILL